ncbi:MAG: hypothetical protein ACRELV_15610 [Longimicrobiales bacterium]
MTAALLAVFVFATVGVKLVLGLIAVYLLIPRGDRCDACDDSTLPLRAEGLSGRVLAFARVERRLCVGCGRTELARRTRPSRLYVGPRDPAPTASAHAARPGR